MKYAIAKPALFIYIAVVWCAGSLVAQTPPIEPGLAAHEWGTFTSVAGNNGQAVEWLPLTGSTDLPSFVEHFRNAGFKQNLLGTVRMETPVIYFYSPREVTLSVQVSFAKGLITEWYPHATAPALETPFADAALYERKTSGTIRWDSVILQPSSAVSFPRDANGGDNHYYAARKTSAAPLRVHTSSGDQQEKFLFYRGVSVFPVPISARFTAEGKVVVKSLLKQQVPNIILFERRGEEVGYRISNGLQNEAVLEPPALTGSMESLYGELEQILMERGLYPDEAHAMLETWHNTWFEEGSRLFYLVPAEFVDSILPLTITPRPAQTVRVFVGRLEIISPATKKAVSAAVAAGDTATLKKYGRFLEPILQAIREKGSASTKSQQPEASPSDTNTALTAAKSQR